MVNSTKLTLPRPKNSPPEVSELTTAALAAQSPPPEPVLEPEVPKVDNFINIAQVDYPKQLYDDAVLENERRTFAERLAAARRPVVKEYTTPPVPRQIAENTRLEMEAGRQRVKEAEELEAQRQAVIHRPREREPWEGNTTPIFRPGEFDEYKGTFKSPVMTPSKQTS